MIRLTRLNHRDIVINADLIEVMEETPDLVITLTSGKKYVVSESMQEVIDRVVSYKRRIFCHKERL